MKPGDESKATEAKAEAAVEPVAADAAPASASAPAPAPVAEAPSAEAKPEAETKTAVEATPAAAASAPASTTAEAPAEEPDDGITLNADERIRAAVKQNERTLWLSAAAVTLLYAAAIAVSVMRLSPAEIAELMKGRRGQDAPDSISVEIVPEPDFKSKTTHWQEGAPVTQQADAPPQPPQQPQVASLEQPKAEEAPTEEQPKPEDAPVAEQQHEFSPSLPDINTLVDAAAADLDRKIKEHLEEQKQRQQQRKQQEARQAQAPGGPLQIRGTGASGRSDPFSRSVIAALLKTRPGPFALWGRVLVSFQISESGQVAYVHLLQSSGNSAMDQAAINAIRKAQFQRPPPGMSPDERTYIIDYIFG